MAYQLGYVALQAKGQGAPRTGRFNGKRISKTIDTTVGPYHPQPEHSAGSGVCRPH